MLLVVSTLIVTVVPLAPLRVKDISLSSGSTSLLRVIASVLTLSLMFNGQPSLEKTCDVRPTEVPARRISLILVLISTRSCSQTLGEVVNGVEQPVSSEPSPQSS